MLSIENSPKLRFKDIYGKDYPKWEEKKLEELPILILDGNYGELYPKADELLNEGIPFIRVNNLKDSKIVNKDMKYISKELHNILLSGHLKIGDVLISTRGEIGITAYVEKDYEDANINAQLCLIRVTDSYLNSKFLLYLFQNTNVQKQFKKLQTGSVLKQLPKRNLVKLKVNFPIIKEQQKIADFFSSVDLLIDTYQNKLDFITILKKAFLQKLFPRDCKKKPDLRFPGFTDDWKKYALKEFGNATSGSSIESEFSENGIYKVINIGSYSEESKYRDQGIRAIDSEKTHKQLLNKNDLTMILNDKTASGNIIGRVLLIDISNTYVYNQRTERIELNCQKFYPLFVYEMLNAPDIRKKIIQQAQGNTQIYVNWSNISLTEYMVPILSEQQILGEFFHLIDKLIMLHQRKLEILQNIKKGLLQQMFV